MRETFGILQTLAFLLSRHKRQTKQPLKSDKVDKILIHYYFRNNPTQKSIKKRMIEIWKECARFKTMSQRLADETRMIIKEGNLLT